MEPFWTQLGPNGWAAFGSLVLLVFGGFIFGWLIPKSTHEREIQMYKDLAKAKEDEAAKWRSLAETQGAVIDKLAGPLATVADFFKKVPVTPKEGDTVEDVVDEITHPRRLAQPRGDT